MNETYINIGAATTEHLNSVLLQIKLTEDFNPSGVPLFDMTKPGTHYFFLSAIMSSLSSCCLIDSYKVTNFQIGGSSLFENIWLRDRYDAMTSG